VKSSFFVLVVSAIGLFMGVGMKVAVADTKETVIVDGFRRNYFVHTPPHLAQAAPVLLVFHGSGKSAQAFAARTGFSELADQKGFIVVYPQGIGNRWNDGRESYQNAPDDLAFIAALVQHLAKNYPTDATRLYATGMSNGASFVQTLACTGTVKLAGIAAVSGTITATVLPKCNPIEPLAVLLINGTADKIMPYNGGEVMLMGQPHGNVESVQKTLEFWLKQNECSGISPPAQLPPLDLTNATRVTKRMGTGCVKFPVVAYAVLGGGHSWPGSTMQFASPQMNATSVIADFFFGQPGQ
jgi:polyhydroxybutyrate depolymerase